MYYYCKDYQFKGTIPYTETLADELEIRDAAEEKIIRRIRVQIYKDLDKLFNKNFFLLSGPDIDVDIIESKVIGSHIFNYEINGKLTFRAQAFVECLSPNQVEGTHLIKSASYQIYCERHLVLSLGLAVENLQTRVFPNTTEILQLQKEFSKVRSKKLNYKMYLTLKLDKEDESKPYEYILYPLCHGQRLLKNLGFATNWFKRICELTDHNNWKQEQEICC